MGEEKKHDDYGRTMKYIGLFGGVQCISLLIGLVMNKAATKLLGGTYGVGLIALYNRTLQMLSDCTNLSLSFSAVRQIAEAHENGDEATLRYWVTVVRSWAFITAVAGVLFALLMCRPLGVWAFHGDDYHTSRFLLLSPVVGFMAIYGSELAILKGTHSLSHVAVTSFWASVCSLFLSVPFYFFWGLGGIFPSIFLIALSRMVVVLCFSVPKFGYRIKIFSLAVLRDGIGMIKMGVGYIFAAILGSGSIWLVCNILLSLGNAMAVGLYSCGYFLMGILPGILFASVDSDYYPRLSAVNRDAAQSRILVNEQIEIQMLVQTPLLICFAVAIPLLLPIPYDYSFMDAVPMVQTAMFAMFLRTLTLPLSYMSLSKGDSKIYLLQEAVYDVLFVVFVVAGYKLLGVCGMGIAISVVYALDLLLVYIIGRVKYAFRLSIDNIKCFLLQCPVFIVAVVSALYFEQGPEYWASGVACILLSAGISFAILTKRVTLMERLKGRLKSLLSR